MICWRRPDERGTLNKDALLRTPLSNQFIFAAVRQRCERGSLLHADRRLQLSLAELRKLTDRCHLHRCCSI